MTCETPICRPRALSPTLYVGAYGIWVGHRLSDNVLIDVQGTIIGILDSSWSVVTIATTDGVVRIRVS